MANVQRQNNSINKTISLAAAAAAVIVMFSLFGAPFVRVLATTTRSLLFWCIGVFLVSALYVFNFSMASIYVGAVWMTLGFYSELEKRGTSWKKTGVLSLLAGLLFAIVSVYLITHGSIAQSELMKTLINSIQKASQNMMTEEEFLKFNILQYLPGVFVSVLMSALALGFIFESKVSRLFGLKREKISTGIKWIEFRTPDLFIWFALCGFLFSLIETGIPHLKVVAINISIFNVVVFFFQGISVVEFMTRAYRVGPFTKFAIYMLIFGWLIPAISLVGFLDYWVNFRKNVRKKLK